MKVASLETIRKIAVDIEGAQGAFRQVPISVEDGTPLFSCRVFTLEVGGHTPFHQHPFEHINYAIEGNGAIVKENGTEVTFKKGDFALIHPNEKHQYRNKSAEKPFVMICAVPKEYE